MVATKKKSRQKKKNNGETKKGHKTSEKTKRKIGLANKKIQKEYWKNLTPKERKEKLSGPGFFKKGHTARVGLKHSLKTLKKMSESHKGVPLSTSHRKALRGRTPWNKGKSGHLSKATIRKMSLARKGKPPANKGRKVSLKARKKMSESKKGVPLSTSHRKALRGRTPYNKGKKGLYKASKKTLKKRSRAMKKVWKLPKYREMMKKRSDAQRGQERSEETKRKISIKNLGSKRSEEARKKMREKRVFQVIPRKDTKPEKILQKLLDEIGIKYTKHKAILGQPDIFINPNILVFGDGDWIHANPNPYVYKGKKRPGYKPDDLIWKNPPLLVKDKWAKDEKITKTLEERGYVVLRFWQSELEQDPEKCLQKIIKAIKKSRRQRG